MSTEQTGAAAPADSDLTSWIDDFIAAPAEAKITRKPFVPPPPVFDAFVMFCKIETCTGCGHSATTSEYLSLRKSVRDGAIYTAYSPDLAITARDLPRLTITHPVSVHVCPACFNGTEIPDETPRSEFHPSRIDTVRDLFFLSTRNKLDALPPAPFVQPAAPALPSDIVPAPRPTDGDSDD